MERAEPSQRKSLTLSPSGITWSLNAAAVQSELYKQPLEAKILDSSAVNSPADALNLLISDSLIQTIADCTNKKAKAVVGRTWLDTSVIELKAFFGLLIVSGVLSKRRTPDTWSYRKIQWQPVHSMALARNRFDAIRRFLRFDDFETRQQRVRFEVNGETVVDKVAAIREIVTRFQEACRKAYYPGKNITVDEQLLGFKGQCSFNQNIRGKPAGTGIKFYIACDPLTGYVFMFDVYSGKRGLKPEKNHAENVVMKLTSSLLPGHLITVDNFFTSFSLLAALKEKGHFLLGTLRANKREIPLKLKEGREKFSSIFLYRDDAVLISYISKTKKNVLLLSSEQISNISLPRRPRRTRTVFATRIAASVNANAIHLQPTANGPVSDFNDQFKPFAILHYNKTKNGVDMFDRLVRQYSCNMPTQRWPVKVFLNLLDMACSNAYTVFLIKSGQSKRTLPRETFLLELGKQLMKENVMQRLPNMDLIVKNEARFIFNLNEETLEEREHSTRKERKRCHLCPQKKTALKTSFCCELCSARVCSRHSSKIIKVVCCFCDKIKN